MELNKQQLIKNIVEASNIYEEIERRKKCPLNNYNTGKIIHKKQVEFHKNQKRNRWVFGGNRSGKTECGAVESIWMARGIHPYRKNKKDVFGWVVSLSTKVQKEVAQDKILKYLDKSFIEEIKANCLENVGAVCHITVPRNEATGGIELYSKHTKEKFYDIWKSFESPMFELKMRHWEEKRKEFCYAGLWSGLLNLGTGEFNACYRQPGSLGNLFENPDEEFDFCPTGKCEIPHCFNGHSFLAWGVIPEINEESYLEIRDRVDNEGNHWINSEMRKQFNQRLFSHNEILKEEKKKTYIKLHDIKKKRYFYTRVVNKIKKIASKF